MCRERKSIVFSLVHYNNNMYRKEESKIIIIIKAKSEIFRMENMYA